MREVIIRTTRILGEKMQTEKEIGVIASKGRNELIMMTVMPFVIIPMLKTLGEDAVSGNNLATVLIRIAGAVIIAGAVLAGKRITDIKM